MDVLIERIEPETLFSWRWHPYAIDANKDYSKEERTLVTLNLKTRTAAPSSPSPNQVSIKFHPNAALMPSA